MSQLRLLVLLICCAGAAVANPIGRHPPFPIVLSMQWFPHGVSNGQPWVQVDLHSNGDTNTTHGAVQGRSDREHNGLVTPAQVRELLQLARAADLPTAVAMHSRPVGDAPFVDLQASLDGHALESGIENPQRQQKAWAVCEKLLQYADPKDLPR